MSGSFEELTAFSRTLANEAAESAPHSVRLPVATYQRRLILSLYRMTLNTPRLSSKVRMVRMIDDRKTRKSEGWSAKGRRLGKWALDRRTTERRENLRGLEELGK